MSMAKITQYGNAFFERYQFNNLSNTFIITLNSLKVITHL